MNIITNETLIKRNARIGQIAMLAGLAVLIGGMYISFKSPGLFNFSILALFLGFILSQVGIYFSNRWGRQPRPDQVLDLALKGLDKKYSIYHFTTPVTHLLVGPAGLWILIPKHQRGTISYSNGRYHQKGGNLYLKIFAQEGLGRPELEVRSEEETINKFLQENLTTDTLPDIRSAIIFTHADAKIEISEDESPPAETILVTKLKDLIRKEAKSKPLSQEKIKEINNLLEED